MFSAEINAKVLKIIVDAVSELSESIVFDITETGIRAQSMDSSHVSLSFLHLKPEGFISYNYESHYNIGISLVSLLKILKCSSNEDNVLLSLNDHDKLTLVISDGSSKSEFELRLMEIDEEMLSIPPIEECCEIKMPSTKFQKIVRNMASMGDDCQIVINDEELKFISMGDSIKISSMYENKDDVSFNGKIDSKYSIRYMQMFTKASALSKDVKINLPEDSPMVVTYDIDNQIVLTYYLAPKIEDNEDM